MRDVVAKKGVELITFAAHSKVDVEKFGL